MGAGTVGLTSMTWARLHGAERITVVDPNAARRDAAERCGATDGLVSADEAAPHSFDVAIDCVGKPGLLNACITATRPKGSIVVAGVCTEQDPFWSIAALMKELTIRFAVYYTPDEFRSVIDAFGSGAVEPAGLMGRTMKLDALPEAFEMLRAGSIAGKILIDPS
jgi:2-desacetyl-2-hydroxyethyl bacteriochlorophyllide A dehydrogenase